MVVFWVTQPTRRPVIYWGLIHIKSINGDLYTNHNNHNTYMCMSYKDLTVFRRWNDGECKGNH